MPNNFLSDDQRERTRIDMASNGSVTGCKKRQRGENVASEDAGSLGKGGSGKSVVDPHRSPFIAQKLCTDP